MKKVYYSNNNNYIKIIYDDGFGWTDARRPVPRLWIRSAEVRGVGGGGNVVRSMGTQQDL